LKSKTRKRWLKIKRKREGKTTEKKKKKKSLNDGTDLDCMAARRGQPCQNEKQAPQWPLFGEQLHCLQRRGRKREGERKRKKKRKKENPSSNFQEKFMNEANLKSGRSFPRGRDS